MSRTIRVVVAAVLGSWAASGARAEGKPPEPLPANVVTAWEKAGAVAGWMGPAPTGWMANVFGDIVFRTGGEGKEGELPAFRFTGWRRRGAEPTAASGAGVRAGPR